MSIQTKEYIDDWREACRQIIREKGTTGQYEVQEYEDPDTGLYIRWASENTFAIKNPHASKWNPVFSMLAGKVQFTPGPDELEHTSKLLAAAVGGGS